MLIPMPKLVEIYHDGFARYSILRQTIKKDYRTLCLFCGKDAKFKYYIQNDDSTRLNSISGKFCSISCMRAYHNA